MNPLDQKLAGLGVELSTLTRPKIDLGTRFDLSTRAQTQDPQPADPEPEPHPEPEPETIVAPVIAGFGRPILDDSSYRRLVVALSDDFQWPVIQARYPDLVEAFRQRVGGGQPTPVVDDLTSPLPPMPSLDDITALQVTVFDNGPKSGKGRWKVRVQAWTTRKVDWKRPAWQGDAEIWAGDRAGEEARSLLKRSVEGKLLRPITSDTAEVIEHYVSENGGGAGIVKMSKRGMGTGYVDQHVVWIDLDGDEVSRGSIFMAGQAIDLPPFADVDSAGSDLRGGAILQARHSTHPEFSGWATGTGLRLY